MRCSIASNGISDDVLETSCVTIGKFSAELKLVFEVFELILARHAVHHRDAYILPLPEKLIELSQQGVRAEKHLVLVLLPFCDGV